MHSYYYVQDDTAFNGLWTVRFSLNGIVEDSATTKRRALSICNRLNRRIDAKNANAK